MLRRFFKTPRKLLGETSIALPSLCRTAKIEGLTGSRQMRRDVGLDCDCAQSDRLTAYLRHI